MRGVGRGCGVGRGLGIGVSLGMLVGAAVTVGVALGVDIGVGVAVAGRKTFYPQNLCAMRGQNHKTPRYPACDSGTPF